MLKILLIPLLIVLLPSINVAKREGRDLIKMQWEPKIIQVHIQKNDTLVFDSTYTKNNSPPHTTNPFPSKINPGERFDYEITWNRIVGGWATIEIKREPVRFWNKECLVMQTRARSSRAVDIFSRVRDTTTVFYDKNLHIPYFVHQIINQGNHHNIRRVFFDHHNNTTLYKNREELYRIEPFSQDILGSLFRVRNMNLVPGADLYVDVVDNRRVYRLKVIVEEIEEVTTPYGTYEAIRVQPLMKSEGIFRHEGRMWVWFTNDERRLPIKMRSRVFIGHIVASLTGYRPH